MIKKIGLFSAVALVLVWGCGGEEKRDALTAKQWQIISYLPVDTEFLLYMNLDELRRTEFWEQYFKTSIQKAPGNNWLSEFEVQTGIGIKKGIAGIYVATTWDDNNVFVVQFSGNIQPVKEYFNNAGYFKPGQVNDKKFYELKSGSQSKFYFVDDSTLVVMNSSAYLMSLLEQKRQSLRENTKFVRLIQNIQNKRHYFLVTDKGSFAAALFGPILGHNKDLPVKEIIGSITSIHLSAEFDDGVSIESVWEFNNSKNAYLLATAIKSAIAVGIFAQKDVTLGKIVEDMTISRYDTKIKFTLELEKDKLNEIRHSTLNNKLDLN
ncbi:MAG: hypothetical protein IPM56_06475 [Ignavibacteriales bacterium]|nr:MAG: hypothetical protein IPM56_06475 [Ignavibacteriales bacterium]